MLTKPNRTPAVSQATTSKKKPKADKEVKQLKVDRVADLAKAIVGKEQTVQVLRFADPTVYSHWDRVCSTRSIAVDTATQVRGFPYGRIVEIYGKESCGKSTLLDHVFAETQALGGVCVLHDSEKKKDLRYTTALGVDPKKLLIIQPEQDTLEGVVEATNRAVDHWLDSGNAGIPLTVGWDSVAGLPMWEELQERKKDTDGSYKAHQPGSAARELRKMMRRLVGKFARAGALFVIVNQTYAIIGGGGFGFGPKSSTYGGGAIRYHSSMRLELIRTGALKAAGDHVVGMEGLVRVFKNQMGVPRDEAFAIEWGRGICNEWSILEKLKEHKYIVPGKWWTYQVQGGQPVTWQGGWMGLRDLFTQHPGLFAEMAALYVSLPAHAKQYR